MTADDRLAQIEARARAATEGPWDVGPPGVVFSTGTDAMVQTVTTGIGPGQVQDAEFIAAARSDVPVLVAALRAVLDVCERSELGWYPEPKYDEYTPGQLDTAERVRAAITAALGEA